MTKHTFPVYAFCKHIYYLCRHLIKARNMKLYSLISRLQELNDFSGEFPPDVQGQKTEPLLTDGIMNTINLPCLPHGRMR